MDITLRKMVVFSPRPKGTVRFLHGFPETPHARKDIALVLGNECEVLAIDWPGYGLSSRPTTGEFATVPALPEVAEWNSIEAAREALRHNLSLSRPARRYVQTLGAASEQVHALREPCIRL